MLHPPSGPTNKNRMAPWWLGNRLGPWWMGGNRCEFAFYYWWCRPGSDSSEVTIFLSLWALMPAASLCWPHRPSLASTNSLGGLPPRSQGAVLSQVGISVLCSHSPSGVSASGLRLLLCGGTLSSSLSSCGLQHNLGFALTPLSDDGTLSTRHAPSYGDALALKSASSLVLRPGHQCLRLGSAGYLSLASRFDNRSSLVSTHKGLTSSAPAFLAVPASLKGSTFSGNAGELSSTDGTLPDSCRPLPCSPGAFKGLV